MNKGVVSLFVGGLSDYPKHVGTVFGGRPSAAGGHFSNRPDSNLQNPIDRLEFLSYNLTIKIRLAGYKIVVKFSGLMGGKYASIFSTRRPGCYPGGRHDNNKHSLYHRG
jgi:hypothetical protein